MKYKHCDNMVKKTVRLNADERAICRVRYKELSKTMDAGSSRSTNEICKAIAAHWKDGGDLETGSEYSALLFPFGNQKAVNRHVKEAHVDAADRAIAVKWVKTQPTANQAQIRELLGLDQEDAGEDDGSAGTESGSASAEDPPTPPACGSKRKASKTGAVAVKARPASKRRRKVKEESASEDEIKGEEDE